MRGIEVCYKLLYQCQVFTSTVIRTQLLSRREDAVKAKSEITAIGSRRINIDFAKKKPTQKQKRKISLNTSEIPEDSKQIAHAANKKKKPEKKFRLIIRNLSFQVGTICKLVTAVCC